MFRWSPVLHGAAHLCDDDWMPCLPGRIHRASLPLPRLVPPRRVYLALSIEQLPLALRRLRAALDGDRDCFSTWAAMFLGSSWRGSLPDPSSTFPKDHAVDRRATAQDAAARPVDTAIVCIPLRDRRVIPGKWPLPQGGGTAGMRMSGASWSAQGADAVCCNMAGTTTSQRARGGTSWPTRSRASSRASGISFASATALP